MLRKLFVACMVLAISLFATAPAFAQSADNSSRGGAVYLMDNAPGGNQVLAFSRAGDGSLAYLGSFATGGLGSGVGLTVPPDPLGSQNSLIVTPDGDWVFAVNAGSNEVSSFKVVDQGLRLVDKVSSGGNYPVSLTYSDGLLYVLNAAGDGSISGFKVRDNGRLSPLKNSTRSLHAATPANGAQPQILEAPAQVGFSPDGNFLVVTDKGGVSGKGLIHVFKLSHGLPAANDTITQTQDAVPFAFTFDRFGHLVVVDASTGAVSSYSIARNGSLALKSVAHTAQAATCWIASNGRFLFTDNTGSGTISGFSASRDGNLTALTANSIVGVTGSGTLPLDIGVSHDGNFVYSLETGAGTVGIFHVNADGTLTSLGTGASYPAVSGFQGIAVH
jgi:6-phosphogluconolactonase